MRSAYLRQLACSVPRTPALLMQEGDWRQRPLLLHTAHASLLLAMPQLGRAEALQMVAASCCQSTEALVKFLPPPNGARVSCVGQQAAQKSRYRALQSLTMLASTGRQSGRGATHGGTAFSAVSDMTWEQVDIRRITEAY
jgi:hypothetical protein